MIEGKGVAEGAGRKKGEMQDSVLRGVRQTIPGTLGHSEPRLRLARPAYNLCEDKS